MRENGVDARDAQGQTPLVLAAAFGSPEAVRLLIANGADVARRATAASQRFIGRPWTSARHACCSMPAQTWMRCPRWAGPRCSWPPQPTAQWKRSDCCSHEAHLNAPDTLGVTPLLAAASVDDEAVAHVLPGTAPTRTPERRSAGGNTVDGRGTQRQR